MPPRFPGEVRVNRLRAAVVALVCLLACLAPGWGQTVFRKPGTAPAQTSTSSAYSVTFSSASTWTVLSTAHLLYTCDLVVEAWDWTSPRTRLTPSSVICNTSTYTVIVTWPAPQSGRLVLVKGYGALGTGSGGSGGRWGDITGTLSSQLDLQTALDLKSATAHNHSGVYEPVNTNIVRTSGSYSDPSWLTISASKVGLGSVENTPLSTWPGSTSVTTLGTIAAGTWNATAIGLAKGGTAQTSWTASRCVQVAADGKTLESASGACSTLSSHALLSAAHSDSTVGTVARGDLITGQGTSALWTRLVKGTANQVLKMDGTATDIAWGSVAWSEVGSKPSVFTPDAHAHAASDVTSATFDNARVGESNVTQHQAALTVEQGQVTNLTTALAAKAGFTTLDTPNAVPKRTSAGTISESGCTIDSSNILTCAGFAGSGTGPDSVTLYELLANGDNFRRIGVPATLTADLELQHANALPAGSVQVYPTPTVGVSQYAWVDVAATATASTIAQRNASGEVIAANTVATGKTALATDGSAASLTSFPTLNQNTSGTAAALAADPAGCTNQFTRDINASGTATCASVAGTDFAVQVANRVFAGPASGGDAAPTFRALVSADIPANAANTSGSAATITGALALANTPLTARGDLLVATTATPILGKLAKGTQYQVLLGGATDPGYGALSLDQATAVSGILGSANGGTGNGYTKFTGPTTTERTFTLPDASKTLMATDTAVALSQLPASTKKRMLGCAVGDPAGSALATGVLCYITCPIACTISAWNILVDAGTATIQTWKIATGTAIPTVTQTISTSGVALSSGTAIRSTTLTDFTSVAVAANDIIAFNLGTVATAKYIFFGLECAE